MRAGSWLSGYKRIFIKVSTAWSSLPYLISHLGDSGSRNIPKNCTIEGIPASPNIKRQLLPQARQIQYEITYPPVMNNTLVATRRPRICGGAASAKYTGTIIAAIPTPRPTTKRPAMSTPTFGAKAIITAPQVKQISAIYIVGFLPSLSENGPAISEPITAPTIAILTIVSNNVAPMPKSSSMKIFAPPITPVS